jgi:hypothetical protein
MFKWRKVMTVVVAAAAAKMIMTSVDVAVAESTGARWG